MNVRYKFTSGLCCIHRKVKRSILAILIMLSLHLTGFSQSCLPEGIVFTRQSQIDSFQVNYPGCSRIEGYVTITGTDIQNLSGLNAVTAIGGDVWIRSNFGLINPTGLENLSNIGGDVLIYNNAIINLDGLDHLGSIGGELRISQNFNLQRIDGFGSLNSVGGDLVIIINDSLRSLHGFDSMQTLGGSLDIHYNNVLRDLSGLSGLDSVSGNLSIYSNHSLSGCAVEFMCRYIADPNGFMNIHDNAPGCSSAGEIKSVCDTMSIPDQAIKNQFKIYPNPVRDWLTISGVSAQRTGNIKIFNQLGQKVMTIEQTKESIRLVNLKTGFYFIEFIAGEKVIRKPFVKN